MKMFKLIFEILLFAISITILMSWGYIKKQKKGEMLIDKLVLNAEKKILKELNEKKTITKRQIENIIKDTKASLYWTKSRLQILEPKKISSYLINDLIEKNIIKKEKKNKYSLIE